MFVFYMWRKSKYKICRGVVQNPRASDEKSHYDPRDAATYRDECWGMEDMHPWNCAGAAEWLTTFHLRFLMPGSIILATHFRCSWQSPSQLPSLPPCKQHLCAYAMIPTGWRLRFDCLSSTARSSPPPGPVSFTGCNPARKAKQIQFQFSVK